MKHHKRIATLTGAAAAVGRTSSRKLSAAPSLKQTPRRDASDRLVAQLAFYGSYHQHRVNKILHICTVPLLLWSVFVLCTYLSEMPASVWSPNPSLLVIVVYTFYYASFDISSCFSWLLSFGGPLCMAANFFRLYVQRAWLWALAVHILAGYLQWQVGQHIYERRKPVWMDAFFQSVLLSPLFVWYEILFALGCCLHLKRQIQAQIQDGDAK